MKLKTKTNKLQVNSAMAQTPTTFFIANASLPLPPNEKIIYYKNIFVA